jgi:1-deoxy-D-xylulose-5-phosphate synthase
MRFIKPLDTELLQHLATEHELLVTLEDNAVNGGAGSAVSEWLSEQPHSVQVIHLGLPDQFLEHASRDQLLAEAGLDSDGIIRAITAVLGETPLAKHATLA